MCWKWFVDDWFFFLFFFPLICRWYFRGRWGFKLVDSRTIFPLSAEGWEKKLTGSDESKWAADWCCSTDWCRCVSGATTAILSSIVINYGVCLLKEQSSETALKAPDSRSQMVDFFYMDWRINEFFHSNCMFVSFETTWAELAFRGYFQMAFGQLRLSVNSSKQADGFWLFVTSLCVTQEPLWF